MRWPEWHTTVADSAWFWAHGVAIRPGSRPGSGRRMLPFAPSLAVLAGGKIQSRSGARACTSGMYSSATTALAERQDAG